MSWHSCIARGRRIRKVCLCLFEVSISYWSLRSRDRKLTHLPAITRWKGLLTGTLYVLLHFEQSWSAAEFIYAKNCPIIPSKHRKVALCSMYVQYSTPPLSSTQSTSASTSFATLSNLNCYCSIRYLLGNWDLQRSWPRIVVRKFQSKFEKVSKLEVDHSHSPS